MFVFPTILDFYSYLGLCQIELRCKSFQLNRHLIQTFPNPILRYDRLFLLPPAGGQQERLFCYHLLEGHPF